LSKELTTEERLLALESDIKDVPRASELDSLIEDKLTKMIPEIVRRVSDEL
jgi:hypothetical protein